MKNVLSIRRIYAGGSTFFISRTVLRSGSFDPAGAQTGSADIHLMHAAFCFHSDRLDIRLPDVVCSSMRMAHIVSEVSCLVTYCTPCHD